MSKIISALIAVLATAKAAAHPGHPTMDPNHVHGRFDFDPALGFALLALSIGVFALVKAFYREKEKR